MGRWADRESDSERLPEGMRRVGYDADTQTYTFQDEEGNFYEGAPGARYGTLYPTGTRGPKAVPDSVPDKDESWRYMAPFVLIICVFLLGVYLLLGGGRIFFGSKPSLHCAENQVLHSVVNGETCWSIATQRGMQVQELESMNTGLNCNKLQFGQELCIKEIQR
ncbi:hypothetical protein BT63DRAFT_473858 [Microthyrium microscopicum]|uniref:LysM domain-containing protein n=1 Tax=Microthyrium microscopicum TaxID=703497 RepID=A0A6A6URR6_9PEZI|nr:hypothetical protein BT63DRAFT_473858 [Microthyrium microscopicum]